MIDIDIDWSSEEDRKRRRTKASTIHGWLRMWRGTFAGNERVRQQGRYEMKVARALRERDAKKSGGIGPFSLFRSLSNRRNAQVAVTRPTPQRHKSSSSRHHRSGSQAHHTSRPVPTKRKSSSSGANKGRHPSRQHSHTRPEVTHHHRSHSANSRTKPSRQASGRR